MTAIQFAARCAALVCILAAFPLAARAQVALSEVFYDATGADDGFEWIELWNESDTPVELAGFSLGWGGSTYLSGGVALSGVVAARDYFVVGGPESTPDNASPVFDLAFDLEGDLQNSGATADGVALFDVPVEEVTAETVPLAAVIYGDENSSGLLDETGLPGSANVADAPGGSSIERGIDGVWRVQEAPTPGAPPRPVPEPSGVALAAASGAALAACATQRAARSRKTRCAF
jgi:Lamin Tail Domain